MNLDSKDYDHVKNLTLLFFLDRLVDKGEPRSLHDLSCQFGTKGFTKEMRQIAGGSQSGLRKFMEHYPSLFTLDGDYVTVTNYSNGVHNASDPAAKLIGQRDYAQEAVEYFITKLKQYGPGTEVPIKSLLGHRSQASPEVRHVSGQHSKEFREFLLRYPDVFVLREENIVLKEFENTAPQPFKELEQVHVDPRLTQQVIQYCAAALLQGPIFLESLFDGLVSACPSEVWTQICRTPNDLSTFLKMHGNTFHIQKNTVSLLQPPKFAPLDLPQPQLQTQVPALISPSPTLSPSPAVSYASPSPSPRLMQQPPPPVLAGPSPSIPLLPSPIPEPTNNSHQPLLQRQRSSVALRSLQQNRESQQNTGGTPSPPPGNEDGDSTPYNPSVLTLKEKQKNSSLKARLNTILRKTIADNERDRPGNTNALLPTPSLIDPNSMTPEQCSKKLLENTETVVSVRRCRQITNWILANRKPISLDGEGVNLGPSGPMTLLQLGVYTGQIYIFDLQLEPMLMSQGGLKAVLESCEVIKVTHDCRGDAGALYHQFRVTLANVFDTQAGYSILQMQETGKPVFKVKFISLNHLCSMFNAPVNPRKDQMKKIYRRDQRFWARRPLTTEMILYAAYDVVALVPNLYTEMKRKMDPSLIDLFAELCEEQVFWTIWPEEVKETKRRRKMETEIEELKARLANTQIRSIVLSNREIRLLRYLELSDEEREKLEGSSKVVKKLERLQNKDRDNSPDKEEDDENDDIEYPSISSLGSGGSSGSGGIMSPRSDPLFGGGREGPCSFTEHGPPSLGVPPPLPHGPASLTHSMAILDQVLSNGGLDRMEKIGQLEAILAAATQGSHSSVVIASNGEHGGINNNNNTPNNIGDGGGEEHLLSLCCNCNCHSNNNPLTSPLHPTIAFNNNNNNNSGGASSVGSSSNPSTYSFISSDSCSTSSGNSPENRPRRPPPPPAGGGGIDSQCQTLSTGDIVITKVYFPESDNSKDNN